jgi:hypothetical protein
VQALFCFSLVISRAANEEVQRQSGTLRAMWRSANVTSAHALGGMRIHLEAYRLHKGHSTGLQYQCKFQLEDDLGRPLYSTTSNVSRTEDAEEASATTPEFMDALSTAEFVACVVPAWQHAADLRAACVGNPAHKGFCSEDAEIGMPCGGHCRHGEYVTQQGSCTGTCVCNFLGVVGRAVCNGGSGKCSCVAPNTNMPCNESTTCTGGGRCVDLGECRAQHLRLYLEEISSALGTTDTRATRDTADTTDTHRTIPFSPPDTTGLSSSANFEIYPVWTSINTSSVLAQGGETILIQGAGFDPSYGGYQCLFSADHYVPTPNDKSAQPRNSSKTSRNACRARTSATVLDSRAIICGSPKWRLFCADTQHSSQSLQLTLVGRHGQPVLYSSSVGCLHALPYPSEACSPPIIRMHQVWYGVETPIIWAASGARLHIAGDGFHTGSAAYFCRMEGPFSNRTAQGIAISDTTVVCNLPAEAGEEHGILIRLLHRSLELEQVNKGLPNTFSVESRWSAPVPQEAGAQGGTPLRLNVFGLPPARQEDHYMCRFQAGGDSMVSPLSILGDMDACTRNGSIPCVMQCTVPPFGRGRAGDASIKNSSKHDGIAAEFSVVRVLSCPGPADCVPASMDSVSGQIRSTALSHIVFSSDFVFVSSHNAPSVTRAYAIGGQAITLQGYALLSHSRYICKFSNQGDTAWSPPVIPINNTISCGTPSWHDRKAPTVAISLMRITTENQTCGVKTVMRQAPTQVSELTFVPVWTAVVPSNLPRNSANHRVTIQGWGFQTDATMTCRYSYVSLAIADHLGPKSHDDIHLGSMVASVKSSYAIECQTPAWNQLPASVAAIRLEIILDRETLPVVGDDSQTSGTSANLFVLRHASSQPLLTVIAKACTGEDHSCVAGSDDVPTSTFRIPQDQSMNVTWLQADVSPYTFVGLSRDSSCDPPHMLKTFSLVSGAHTFVKNDFDFAGRVFICYSSEGRQGIFQHQPNLHFISEARATASSVTSFIPSQANALDDRSRVLLRGAGYSSWHFVAFLPEHDVERIRGKRHLSDSQPFRWEELLSTSEISRGNASRVVALSDGREMQAGSLSLELVPGRYRICYSTSGPDPSANWVLQDVSPLIIRGAGTVRGHGRHLLESSTSNVIFAISPVRATSGVEFNLTFEGAEPSPFTAVAVAGAGSCNDAEVRGFLGCEGMRMFMSCLSRLTEILEYAREQASGGASVLLNDSKKALLTLSAGVYSVCHSIGGLDGPYVEQENLVLEVVPASKSVRCEWMCSVQHEFSL